MHTKAATHGTERGNGVKGTRGSITSRWWRIPASVVYPGGDAAYLPILVYHRVLREPDPYLPDMPDEATLDGQFRLLSEVFHVMRLDEAVARMKEGRLPARAACITFDDGYRDNHEVAVPLLERYGLKATFFVASGMLDGGRMFHDTVLETLRRVRGPDIDLGFLGMGRVPVRNVAERRAAATQVAEAIKYLPPPAREELSRRVASMADASLPDDLMMTSDAVRDMARRGMEIGGHTVDHPNLAQIGDTAEAAREIAEDRQALGSLVGQLPTSFAYPFGTPDTDFRAATVKIVEAVGYQCAVTMRWGVATRECGWFELPRFGPAEKRPASFLYRMLRMASHRDAVHARA